MVDLQTLVDFFLKYGYQAVFVVLLLCGFGLPVPEDISLVAGGIISGLGYTNVHLMFIIAFAGVLIGDSTMFMIGRLLGERIFNSRFGKRVLSSGRYESIKQWLGRYGKWVIFCARFMPGLRTPIFLTTGVTRFASYTTFILIDGTAALISVPFWVYLGYFGASRREWLMKWLSRGQIGIIILVVIVALFIIIRSVIQKKIKKKLNPNSTETGQKE